MFYFGVSTSKATGQKHPYNLSQNNFIINNGIKQGVVLSSVTFHRASMSFIDQTYNFGLYNIHTAQYPIMQMTCLSMIAATFYILQ